MSKVARSLRKNKVIKVILNPKPTVVTEACLCVEHKALSVSLLVVFIFFHEQLQSIHPLHLLPTFDDHGALLHLLDVGVGAFATDAAIERLACKPVETVAPWRKADWPFVLRRFSLEEPKLVRYRYPHLEKVW